MPVFSVIIPTFNRVHFCPTAVKSVLNQDFKDFELIVVDDGSTDGTPEALAQFGDRIRLFRQENKGQSIARNTAIAAATGEYVAFLDSDDQWFPWTLATVFRAIEEGKKPAMIAGKSVPFWTEPPVLETLPKSFVIRVFDHVLDFFARSKAIVFETGVLVIRTDVLKAAGGFSPTRDNSEDVDLCLRICTSRGFVRLESPPLFAKLSHANNIGMRYELSASGLMEIFRREETNAYPGGAAGRRARLKLIGAAARNNIYLAAQDGNIALTWKLYRKSALLNLRQGRLRFVFGVPALTFKGLLRRCAGATRSPA